MIDVVLVRKYIYLRYFEYISRVNWEKSKEKSELIRKKRKRKVEIDESKLGENC